ncbi:ABC transporter permease [Porphyromonas sp.]|uniref:MlaE family ABC transporter permease n=1 Tax=Porphyromonas sp. TaxID=1924944 RepID=UPI0026DBA61F|nr:ABC transporter permease [Porphyromonas sp.]MDO4695638.1 ABC transporter permease [Porphyromonas sp.]MDO4771534.1 ABC transporter permease [Porphyromonas sp.]
MILRSKIETFGEYTLILREVFRKPGRWRMFFRELRREMYSLGVDSLWIVLVISFFIGSVITIQLGINMSSPLIPKFTIGFTAREVILLEFSSTIMGLILAGKVGSSIASEIGTMRVTEQIDAMDIMGVNSANYLILPKIMGLMLMIPFLVILSMFIGIGGGYIACTLSGDVPPSEFVRGIQFSFNAFYVFYSIIKAVVYAFLITSIAAYYGYTVKGGALQVGKASTKAVVSSSISILVADLLLTQMLLV